MCDPLMEKSRLQNLLGDLPKLLIEPPSKSFTCFPKLPIELRYKIWSYASRVPQKVKLCITTNDYSAVAILGGPKTPAILHGCFESRKVALKFYTLCRQEIVPGSELLDNIKTHRRSMYVNFDIDRFRITGDSTLRPPPDPILFGYSRPSYRYTYSLDIMRQIRLVELEIDTISKPRERWTYQITRLWKVLGIGQSLQELILVHKSSPFGDTRSFKVESFKGHLKLDRWRDKQLLKLTTLLMVLGQYFGDEQDDTAEVRVIGVDIAWDALAEVECCPGYIKNGKCFREKGNMEENAEYLLYLSASGLL
ncbi:hypothetical protein V8E51_019857 [Hyaloscypha variabilis]